MEYDEQEGNFDDELDQTLRQRGMYSQAYSMQRHCEKRKDLVCNVIMKWLSFLREKRMRVKRCHQEKEFLSQTT